MGSKGSKILIQLIWERRFLLILALLLALTASGLEGLGVVLMLPLLQLITSGEIADSLSTNIFLQTVAAFFAELPGEWRFQGTLICIWLTTGIKNIVRYFSDVSINKLQLQIGYDLRTKCIHHFLGVDLLYYNHTRLGDLLSIVNEQVQRTERLASSVLEVTTNLLTIAILSVLLFTLSPSLSIITILSLSLIVLLLQPILKFVKQQGRATAAALDAFSSVIAEIISGIRIVKGFHTEMQELIRAKQVLDHRYDVELKAYKAKSSVIPVTETLGITLLVVLVWGATIVWRDSASTMLPLLFTYALALLRILPRVNHLNGLSSNFSLVFGSLETVGHFLGTTANQHMDDGSREFKGLEDAIEFQHVSFTFPGNSEPTLKNISFTIPKGKMTALIGPSGSGKSTIADLVMRFYDPDEGSIRIDGVDLREFTASSWRSAVAMVSQDTFLFHASVRDNISYGSPMATEKQIIEAAEKAYAYSFIQQLPQGFDTLVGNRGTKLSGGQRQRIAIARAILRDPDILILDEATSALDTASERIVQRAIEEISKDRTVLVIAHRLSTIEKAEKVIVLRNGHVVETYVQDSLCHEKASDFVP